ncbi:MAG: peroxide stress protein YaaA [Myxococcales bacterium]|nr:peroxide stress protein YaaA [Myxococcales bacterium]MCB9524083.1 peroxide stress protein YaaA [Myxococcales bacterium]
MLAVLSPAKKLTPTLRAGLGHTQPALQDDIAALMKVTRRLTVAQIRELMDLSESLGQLNFERFQAMGLPFDADNAVHALFSFAGDTYVGLQADTLTDEDVAFAQDHVAILSGLYGLLRPLDLMQPYRLEMGTGLATRRGKTLYAFWGARLAAYANQLTAGHSDRTVVVCASSEYSKALRTHKLAGPVITPVFKEEHNGKLSVISFYAKQARGMLARYLVDERLTTPEGLKAFDRGGYRFDPELSSADEWVFWRPKPTPKGK